MSHIRKWMFFQTTSSTLLPIVGDVWTTSFIKLKVKQCPCRWCNKGRKDEKAVWWITIHIISVHSELDHFFIILCCLKSLMPTLNSIPGHWLIEWLECFFNLKGHAALDRNMGPGYNTLLLRSITLLSACPHRQFHTLPDLLHNQSALSNSYPNACMLSRDAVCTVFVVVFGMTQLVCEPTSYHMRRTH